MQRTRLLIAAAALVVVGAFGFAGPAHAQGEGEAGGAASHEELIHEAEELAKENGGSESDAHCVEMLLEGDSVDDCQAAPNPLLPEVNEILWGAFGFAVVFAFLKWKGWPAIKAGMEARTERIRGDLDAAESAKAEAEAIKADYEAKLADARAESARIVEEARQAADEVRTNLIAKAEADAAEVRTKAAADAEAIKAQAMSDIRGDVAELAIAAAERIVGQTLDREANTALVESFIDSVGATS